MSDTNKGSGDLTRSGMPYPKEPFWRFWEYMAVVAFSLGILFITVYSISSGNGGRVFGILTLLALASWLGGSLLGFLFGVPRYRAGQPNSNDDSGFIPNTNLEQISDWLTKIIVGATLVQLSQLSEGLGRLANFIGKQVDQPGAAVVSGSVLLFFLFAGFMWGYLWCSLRVFQEMARITERYQPVSTG